MEIKLIPCSCGGEVFIYKSAGGARFEYPTFAAQCKVCGKDWDNLGYNRRQASGTWNRIRREKIDAKWVKKRGSL